MMLLPGCKRRLRLIALALICFAIATPLMGSNSFVLNAIARSEAYAGIANGTGFTNVDPHRLKVAKPHTQGSTSLIFLHLTGTFGASQRRNAELALSGGVPPGIARNLPAWDLVYQIFHPPKRVPALS